MAKTDFKSVDEYIAKQPRGVQALLRRVRGAVRKAVPAAEERISYQIPAYKLPGGPLLFFAAWKEHYSLYPATRRLLKAFEDDLAPYEVRNATLRFRFDRPVPVGLIARLARFRAREIGELLRAKRPAAGKR